MASEPVVPVLIAGAGPVGLVAALTLRQNNIPVRIIEKEERIRVGQRGAAIMPRSLELYNFLGVLSDLRARAISMVPMRVYKLPEGREPLATFLLDPPVQPTPYVPFTNISMLAQEHTETILRAHLARHGCEVELGTELQGFEQNRDHVLAHVKKNVGVHKDMENIACRWLIGADGAKGIVRRQLGLSFLGETLGAGQHLVVGDLEIRGLDHEHWHSWGTMDSVLVMLRATEDGDLYFTFVGGKVDHARLVADRDHLLHTIRTSTGRHDLELGAIKWLTEWKPNIRMVDQFSKGRVLVAGDAAHVHSPFGGQGLNSGIQDAVNLGWKLALVEKGVAHPSILETYTEERLPVIAEVLKTSNKLFNSAVNAKGDGETNKKAWHRGGSLNQLGVNYRWSSIIVDDRFPREEHPTDPYGVTHNPTDPVRAGERAPDAPGLVLAGSAGDAGRRPKTASLFSIYRPFYHTILIFAANADEAAPIVGAMKAYPSELIRTVFIYPQDTASDATSAEGVDITTVDGDGHAHIAYGILEGPTVVIIRPDGVIGGVVCGLESLRGYFRRVFSGTSPKL
ncbi:monooxygenase [Laetiporus sulphureus 93-53]|uniref:Monooxygenase n=1 Tax=Laetiporus sulphureus 93-53 TaxID=1314785 RepID=A0A165DQB3_9APHY|nr:monooxygenase [Laetiporus sulphureus 93-53]KZT05391.1 monooxygenase [Laetiporus sulphureus 93-53]